jgi:hypothetical protein
MREATMALMAVLADLPCCVLPSRGVGEMPLREPSTAMPG